MSPCRGIIKPSWYLVIRVEWRSTGLVSLKDCIELGSAKWFGGSEEYFQHFPLDLDQV